MFIKVQLENDSFTVSKGPNFVLNKDYSLYKEQANSYNYPVDGWYWVTTLEEIQNLPPIQDLLNKRLIEESDLEQYLNIYEPTQESDLEQYFY